MERVQYQQEEVLYSFYGQWIAFDFGADGRRTQRSGRQETLYPRMFTVLACSSHRQLLHKKETKQILKKQTEFERALVRRVAQKSDFLRYLDYEMELESLRRKRFKRLGAFFLLFC
jgi:hypothetical protein